MIVGSCLESRFFWRSLDMLGFSDPRSSAASYSKKFKNQKHFGRCISLLSLFLINLFSGLYGHVIIDESVILINNTSMQNITKHKHKHSNSLTQPVCLLALEDVCIVECNQIYFVLLFLKHFDFNCSKTTRTHFDFNCSKTTRTQTAVPTSMIDI